jgi:hypothetical protein
MRKIVIAILVFSALLFISSADVFASTGSDVNKAGYGPIMNGVQLGAATSLIDFSNTALKNYLHIFKSFSLNIITYGEDGKKMVFSRFHFPRIKKAIAFLR